VFSSDVLDHIDEQLILLITSAFMMVVSVDWSNRCFTRLIWQSLEIHDDDKYCTCSLHFNLESNILSKSLTCDTGSRVFPIKLMLGTWSSYWSNCCDPTTIILVLSGFISKLFLQHHSNTLCKSSSIVDKEEFKIGSEKDRYSLESSTLKFEATEFCMGLKIDCQCKY
jgi:hypothetical protein